MDVTPELLEQIGAVKHGTDLWLLGEFQITRYKCGTPERVVFSFSRNSSGSYLHTVQFNTVAELVRGAFYSGVGTGYENRKDEVKKFLRDLIDFQEDRD